jgi:hypothetical protein
MKHFSMTAAFLCQDEGTVAQSPLQTMLMVSQHPTSLLKQGLAATCSVIRAGAHGTWKANGPG